MEERLAKVEALGSKANWAETEEFLNSVVKILLDYLKEQADPESKVLDFHHPEELRKLFNFELSDEPAKLEDLLEDCAKALKYQVRTGHPRFFNQLSCGLNTVSLAGEWLTAAANTNMFTYEIAPVFILMEKEVLRNMWEAVGWTEADGIFAPGGAVSNLYAVNAARHHLYPRSKPLGMVDTGRLCMFTSEDAHYSMMGAAAVCGIGTDRCFLIPTDARHRMIPEALEGKIAEARAEGLVPFFVSATAGSTVYGAFDPIHAIADIAAANNMWCHVDAAWGGGVLLSEKHRELMSGVERANSVTWNPHKILGTLLQCSAVLIRHEGLLFQCNQMSADYLFQQVFFEVRREAPYFEGFAPKKSLRRNKFRLSVCVCLFRRSNDRLTRKQTSARISLGGSGWRPVAASSASSAPRSPG